MSGQVLLNETGTEVNVDLHQWRIADATKAVNLSGLDDQNVACAGFEFLSVDGPEAATFPHDLDFIIRMTMGPRATSRERAEEKHGDVYITVIGPDELVRAALKGQVLLTNTVHPAAAPVRRC
jgi:hypothetical protein